MSNKVIIGVVAAVVVLVLGYGFYNASKVRSYAKDVKDMVMSSNAKWDEKSFRSSKSATELQKRLDVVSKDTKDNLAKLDDMSAPGKDKDLEVKAKEYYTLAENTAGDTSDFLTYISAIEKSGKELKGFSVGGAISGKSALINSFTKLHKGLSVTLTKLKAVTPPPSFRNFHDKYVAALERMDRAIVKALGYAKADKFDKIQSVLPELESASLELSSGSVPSTSTVMKDILTQNEKDKLDSLPAQIDKVANDLMKTTFSF